jgi:hypothetical protein
MPPGRHRLAVLRDKHANTAWTASSDGTLEERSYYCPNWRADVSDIVSSGGQPIEGRWRRPASAVRSGSRINLRTLTCSQPQVCGTPE